MAPNFKFETWRQFSNSNLKAGAKFKFKFKTETKFTAWRVI